MQVRGETAHDGESQRVPGIAAAGLKRPGDRVLDGDRLGVALLEIGDELAQELLGPLELVAERAAHGQVVDERRLQRAHRATAGQARATPLRFSRSTLA